MMQQTMRFFAKICAMTALCASVQIYADTVTVDGVVWTYAVKNGEATVGSGESNGDGAVAKTTAGAVIIPSTLGGCPVTKIAMYAFEDCKNLTEVVIPDSVRSAEWMAFYGCSSLTRVKFGAGFQRMEGHCFEGCKSLATIDIPSTITSIPSFCFRSCGFKVLAIPSQITRIGEYAFSRCNDLTTIAIGANLSSIGEEAFSHSPKLSSITIDAANNRFKVKDGILYDTNSEAAIVGLSGITSVEIEDGTTEIHGGAFSYASPTSISIPSSVTRIGSWAFGSNGDATLIPGLLLADGWIVGTDWSNGSGPVGHLDLTGVRGIAEIAVMSSPNLTGVLLPPVKTIPLQAFDFCASLVEVNIPDGVESIGMYAFENCTSLPEITIPSSVTNIGYRAFGGDANLLKVYLPKHFECEENIRERVFPSCPDALALVFYEEGELNFASVTFIANDGSEDKTSKRVLVGNAVGNLPVPKRSGFLFDGWWTDAEGGTRIDSSFLMPAEGLSVYAHWVECAYDWSYNASESGVVITGVSPAEGDVEIPSQIGGVPVVGIADFAFENSAGLTGIAIPSSVTNIGYGAFYLCPSLVKMTLPVCVCDNTCPLLNIFDNPYGLKEVVINAGVEAIGDYVFSGALNLRKVTIPDSVKRISQRAFDVSSACFDITNYPGLLVVDGWVVGENLEMDPAAFEGVESLDLSEYKGVVDGATFLSVFPNLREIVLPQSTKSFDAAYSYLFPLNGYTKRLVFPAALTKLNADGMMNLISYGNIEFFFKGNAPELVYDSVAYPYGYEFYSGADVRILVKRTTSGWGGVPGTWHGIPVDYVAMEEDDQPQEPSDFAEWANAVKGGVYSGRWCTGKLAGFAAGYQARIAANPNDYEARLLHAAAIVLSLGENETFKGYLKTFGFEIDYLGLKLSGEESDPGTWPAANELVDALVAQCAPVLQTALEDLRAIPDGWTGEVRLDSTTWPLDEDVYIDIADILYARAGLESVLGTLYFLKGYDLTVDWPKARSLDKPPIPVLADAPSFESDDGWDGALTLGSRCYEDSSVGPSVQMAFADRNLYIRFNSAEGFDAEDSLSDIWIDGIVGTREIQVQYSAWDGNSVVNNGAVSYPEWTEGMEWAEWNELYNSYAANNVSCPVEISKSTNSIIIKIDMSGAGMDDNFGRMSYDYASFTLRHPNRPHYQWGYLNDYYSYDCDERLNWIPSFQKEQTNFFSSVRSLDNLEYAHDWMRVALIESLAAYVAMTNRAEDGKYRFLEYDPSLSNQFDVARMTTEKAIAALYAVTTVDCKETFGKYNPEKDYTLLPNNGVMQVYLGSLFSGRFNRGLVPTLELDKYATLKPVGAISDPTFGGILPQTTSSQLIETLDNYGIAHGLTVGEPLPIFTIEDGELIRVDLNGATEVTIPDSVTSIGEGAFYGCSGLTSVTIGNGVTNIGSYAFYYCSGLTNVTFNGNAPIVGRYAFLNVDTGCTACVRKNSTGWGVDIPGTWQGMRIEYLDEGPQPIFAIENGVLTAVDLNGATNVVIPSSVTSIGYSAFEGCVGLTSVTIPDSVTSIGDRAFYGCSGLTSVTIPDGVTSIGGWSFYWCSSLMSVAIPSSVTNIGFAAFFECRGLANEFGFLITRGVLYGYYGEDEEIVLPDGIASIGDGAFYCSTVKSVMIPDSVTLIGEGAFVRSGVTNLIFEGDAPSIGEYAFDGDCVVRVHRGSTGWGVDIPGTWQGMRIEYFEPDGPDLIIDGVVAEPTSFQPGDKVTVQYVADNYGVAEADGNWYDRIALEDTQGRRVALATVAETGPLPFSPLDMETGWRPVGGFSRAATCVIPNLVPLAGEVRFVVIADVNNDIEEMDESNNEAASDWLTLGKRLYLTAASDSVKENVSGGVRFTVRRSGPVDGALTVSVGNTDAASASIPATVTIPAGSVSTIFTVAPIDNSVVDGTRVVSVSVSAGGFAGAFVPLTILDDEVPKLTVALDKTSIREGDGVITATVTREGATDEPLTVYISGTSGSRASYPSSVVIPAGATSVTFDISVPNNDTAQVASELTLRASSSGYQSSAVTYTVEDDDVPGVVLTIAPEVVQEGAGASAAVMTLARVNTEDMSKAITVRLTASVANVLIMPKEVVIPANNPYVRQEIGVVDNSNVEANKEITITGAIVIPSCNCSAQPSSGGEIQTMLRIIDDDSLALKLRVEPLMMKEGQEIAGYITVGQNTVLTEELAVSLYSDNDAEIELPPTVVIPAGETSARVPVKTLNDGVEDGTVQVNIYAEADGYAPDSKWVFVTDQNLPDVMPVGIEPQYAVATAGESVSVSFVVTNIGYLASKRSVPFSIYCVKGKSAIIEDAGILVFSGMTDGAVDIGASAEVSAIVTVPDITGDCRFAVVVDPDRLITELNDANNTAYSSVVSVSPSYIAEAQVEGERFLQGSAIEINGVAVKADGTTPAANVDVEIYVIKNEFRRQLKATTDAQGRFAATFKPTTSEAGHYVVGASFPGMNATAEQDAFDILGMKRTSDAYLEYNNIPLGDEMSKTVYIRNMSSIALTGISAEVVGVLSGCEIETSFADVLSGDATIPLTLTLRGTDLTSGRDYKEFTLRLTSAEGSTLDIPVLYFVQYQQAHIKASPASINTTMTVGQTRYVDFTIYNDGRGDSGKVTILTSPFPWLSIEGGNEIANLASNESAIVTLKLTPGDDVELNNRYTGEIAVNCESGHGKGCVVPFAFKAVSEHTGSLKVDVIDGYTYYLPDAPHVSNATVRISNKYTGEIVAFGTTGIDGMWASGEIGEGKWQLAILANGHKPYYNEVAISPGMETILPPIYLEAQSVSISYSVTPTNIVDTYVVTLVTEYETAVPEPVLVTTFDGRIPNLQEGDEPFAFNAIIVNKGLVAVHGVYLEMPTIEGWEFTVGDSGFSLAPEESAVVPIIVRRPRKRTALMAAAGAVTVTKVDCVDVVRTRGYWYCGGDRRWHVYTVQLPTERVCTTTTYTIVPTEEEPRPPSKPGRIGGGGGGYSPSGGGSGTSRITISKTDCEPCVNSVREALLNCDITEDIAQRYQNLYDLLKDHYLIPEHVSKVPWFSDNQSFFGLSENARDIIYDMGLLANECYYDGTNNGFMRENFPYQVVDENADGKPLSELISWPFYISDGKVVRSEWSDGFAASIYRDANGNYVLAFRGTEKDLNDISNDRRNAFLCEQTDQYRSAGLLLGQLLITTGDSHIDVTGHSLGGGLAQYAMAVNGYYADRFNGYTFNSAGQCSKLGLGFSMAVSGIKTALKGKHNYYEIFKLGEEYGQNIFDMMRVDDLLYSEHGNKAAEKIINVRNKHDPVSFYGRHLGAIFDIDNSSVVTHSMEELLVNMRRDESSGINEWKEKKKAFLMLVEGVLDTDVPDDVMSCIDNISSICAVGGANGKEKLAERVESAKNGELALPEYNTGNAELDLRLANLDVARQISAIVNHVSDCVFGDDADGGISAADAKFLIDALYDLPHPVDKQSLLAAQPSGWSDSKLDKFVQRWNDTIAGLVVDEYNVDGGINLPAINDDMKALRTLFRYAISEPAYDEGGVETPFNVDSGYTNIADLLNDSILRIRTVLDKSSGSVCAKVTLELSQEVTMTREAFLGTLSVSNGHTSKPITDMKMEIEITDENGERCENLFQPENAGLVTMQGTSILAGGVSLAANSSGSANILFTPNTKAAETVPKVYYFGGTVTYTDPFVGETVRVKLQPAVPVTVHPSPELTFHYFLQRDVIGDDPFTKDVVEESEPAEVALLILNKGYGDAENVTIKTAEPTITENEKELKVDFNWIGAALDGASTRLGYRNVDVGTVPAQGSRLAQWWLTSSLQGHFTKVDGSYTRLNSNGNPDFDLIKDVITHTLVRSIMADNDTLPDFLVTEGRFDGIPNVIYMDNGETVDVSEATDVTISGAGANATLTVVPGATGWNYASCRHPFGGGLSISRVTRGDGSEVPLRNVWLTSRTFEDGVDPIVEDRIHIADEMVYGIASTYTIEFGGATPTVDRPQVLGFFGVSELIDGIPAAIEVQFSHDVDATTFDVSDLTLYHQGTAVADLSGLSISANGTSGKFAISGFGNLGLGSGTYVLTVQSSGVKDLAGISGTGSKSVMWTVVGDTTPPAQIADLAISPDGGFSDTDGVTYTGALTVTGTLPEAGLTVEIIAQYVGGGETTLATIDGEGAVATQFSQDITLPSSGNVTLVVRLMDAAGNSSDTEKGVFVDGIALTGALTGASEDEGVVTTSATLAFSDKVMDGDVAIEQFSLVRNGESVALEGVMLAKADDAAFSLSGLDALCAEDGVYELRFDGSSVRKYTSGLTMGGSLVMRWRYKNPDREPPTVTAVRFDGETPHGAYTNVFSSVDVIFSEAVNVPELIENGLIQRAARIDLLDVAGTVTGCVAAVRRDGDIAPYQWNVDANTLSWQIDSAGVPAGGARLMLDAGLIRDLAGNRLAVDENGQAARSTNGLRTYTLSETLLAQVNAQAMPMWYNGELYVGEKTVDNKGKIRHYAANGTWTYLQSDGVDIEIPAQGCQGASVAFADMDGDGAAETYIGTTAGDVLKYPGGTAIASLGANRAMPYAYDIDGDGRDELITGGMDGRIRIISLDEDSSTYSVAHISDVNGAPITVLNGRAAPMVADINHDGLADIVSGDTAGNVWAYLGVDATSASLPVCAMPVCVFTNGVGLADRSRLGYGDVNDDGIEDIIVGRSDGSVTVMYGAETPSPAVPFAVKAVVSASAGTHGAITPVGDVTYDGGDAPEYTITPNVGYHVVDVQIDGVSIGVTNGYVFVPLTTSHAIHADFAVTPYAITYTGLKGATNPNPTSYTVEDAITFAAPGEIYGWVFKGWTPVFVALGSTGAVEVTANWERQKFDVTVNGETKQYNYEDVATFTTDAVINCGATQYVCKGWSATNADPASGEGARAEFRVLGDVTLDWQRETNVVTIAQAANAEGFEWTTGGAAEWMPEWSDEAADNVHQARCGAIPNGTNAWLATTVEGPGMLVFKWRSALASRNTKYQLMVDGEVKGMLTGTNEWTETSFAVLGDKTHEIKWRILTGRSGSAAGDGAALDCVAWTPTVPPTLAEALNTDLVWTTEGNVLWRGVARESLTDSRDAWAVVSGLGDNGTSAVQTRVYGSGILFFDWAISCEEDYDWMELTVDGEVRDYVTGCADWTSSAVEIVGDGWHVVRWEYVKDEVDDLELASGNIAMLDNVIWNSDETAPEDSDLIPVISLDTLTSAVDAKVDSIGFADAAVKMAIGGHADEYMLFKAWADVVRDACGEIAGELAVVDNKYAAAAFLLGAERLFENEPTVEIGELAIVDGESAGTTAMTIAVTVKDGESVVKCVAEKVASMFEATSDLVDWTGTAKLTPTVTTSGTDASGKMTFVVTPGDGTAAKAFLRIRR